MKKRIAFVMYRPDYSIPLGIAYLVSVLGREGWDVSIFEIHRNEKKVINRLRALQPEIVAYSVLTGTQNTYLKFNSELRRHFCFTSLFGGPHPTFFPEMIGEKSVDIVCMGEAEEAIIDFVRQYRTNDLPEEVPNFLVKKKDKVFKNPVRPLIKDLDSIPFPERKMFYDQFSIYRHHGIQHFLANRGCPFRCSFCFNAPYNAIYKGNPVYRSRDPQKICEEINLERSRVDVKMVRFIDDSFTLNKQWLRRFVECYKDEVGLPFSINTRFDMLDDSIVADLKEANCSLIFLGVESGSERVRNRIMGRDMHLDSIYKGAALLRKYRIKFLTENIIGVTSETLHEAFETLILNMKIKPDFANCSLFAPYPKLALTQFAMEAGYFKGDFSKITSSYYYDILADNSDWATLNKKRNIRCFFSLIAKYPSILSIFERFILSFPANACFRFLGNIVDGYLLKKLLPYRFGFKSFFCHIAYFIVRYRKRK
jgi:anaerobic magnesium-protoporphyrin IX monomethyl ester cyclase